jgi:shikimate kinase
LASANSSTEGSRPTAIFLVGFMGAGKTSVGRALERRLHWTFEDLDDRIERREKRTVAEMFRDSGESVFRRAEHNALQELIEELRGGSQRVVALGGGAFTQADNAALLHASGWPTVFLDAPVEELWRRCTRQASGQSVERPLLRDREQFGKLYESRRKSYAKASITMETGNREVEAIAAEIAETLHLRKLSIRTAQGEVE